MAAVFVVPRRSSLGVEDRGLDVRTGGAEALLDKARLDGDLFGDDFLGVVRFGGSEGFGVDGFGVDGFGVGGFGVGGFGVVRFGVVRFGGSEGFGVDGFTAGFAAGAVVIAGGAVVTGAVMRPCNMPKLELPGNGMPRVLHILFK